MQPVIKHTLQTGLDWVRPLGRDWMGLDLHGRFQVLMLFLMVTA